MNLNTPQNLQQTQEVQAEGFDMALTVPRPKNNQESVDRPQKTNACKTAQESHRTISLTQGRSVWYLLIESMPT